MVPSSAPVMGWLLSGAPPPTDFLASAAVLFTSGNALNSSAPGDLSHYSEVHVQTKGNNAQTRTLQLFLFKAN